MSLAAAEHLTLRFSRCGSELLAQFRPFRLTHQRFDHERVGSLTAAGGQPGDAALEVVRKLQARCGHRRLS